MRRSLLWVATGCFALLLGGAAVAAAESGAGQKLIKTLSAGIPHDAFFGISFDAGKGVAVGAGGVIQISSDAGATWTPVKHGLTSLALLAVDKRGSHTVAVGQTGLVMIEEAPGKWAKIDPGVVNRLFSVSVNSSGLVAAVGEFGAVLKSLDGGRTWTSMAPDWAQFADAETFGTGEPSMYAAYVGESGEITIAGEYGVMLRSNDQGASWKVLRKLTPGTPTLFAILISAEGQGNSYAVGQEGELLISADNGLTWGRCTTNTRSNFLGIAASPNGQVVVTGMRVMLHSSNSGVTWEAVEEGDTLTDWYQAVRLESTSDRIIAVGHSGRIIQVGS
ncbi:MAG: WD40/YVTN/BNR-like repeat-containing protein [Panacagrimonas sp.]